MDLSENEAAPGKKVKAMDMSKIKKVKSARWKARLIAAGSEFGLLFIFWVLLSGRYQLKYLLIGAGASAVVTYLTNDLLYKSRTDKAISSQAGYTLSCVLRWMAYIPWLVWAIIKANIMMAMIIIKPQMPVNPGFLRFKTRMTKKASLVTLANSITLTPGTITVDLKNGTYIVHAISREAASDLESGLMQNKAGAIFSDFKDTPPTCLWTHSCKEPEK